MNLDFLKACLLIITFSNCANQSKFDHQEMEVSSHKLVYPIKIEIGAIGKGSNLPPSIIIINQDSVTVSGWDKAPQKGTINHSIATIDTDFNKLISTMDEDDLRDKKHYYNPFIRDGGYMIISNESGVRKFTNALHSQNKFQIQPDTIGLTKFENISNYSLSLLHEFKH